MYRRWDRRPNKLSLVKVAKNTHLRVAAIVSIAEAPHAHGFNCLHVSASGQESLKSTPPIPAEIIETLKVPGRALRSKSRCRHH